MKVLRFNRNKLIYSVIILFFSIFFSSQAEAVDDYCILSGSAWGCHADDRCTAGCDEYSPEDSCVKGPYCQSTYNKKDCESVYVCGDWEYVCGPGRLECERVKDCGLKGGCEWVKDCSYVCGYWAGSWCLYWKYECEWNRECNWDYVCEWNRECDWVRDCGWERDCDWEEQCTTTPITLTGHWCYCWTGCCTVCWPGDCGTCDPNDWGAWGACSVSCGGGTQSRTNDCGDTQSRACNTQACCDPNLWGAWGACSVSCGGGTQTRTNDCGRTQSRSCNNQACCDPNLWGAWGACSVSCGGGTQSRTNDCGNTQSRSCNNQACKVSVEGYLWEATDKSCSSSKPSNEITSSHVNSAVPSLSGKEGTWNTGFSGKNYEITDITPGNNKALSADLDAKDDLFKYKLKCYNNSEAVGNTVFLDVNSDTTAHLGYELISEGWFQALGGGIFAGGSGVESISVGLPGTAGNFTNYLIDGPGSLFTTTLFSIQDTDGDDRIVDNDGTSFSDNEYYFEDMGTDVDFWPPSFSFNAPNSADNVSNLNNLDAGNVYEISSSRMSDISGRYRVSGNGVAVVYVDGNIEFSGEFTSRNSNRILLIVSGNVTVGSDIGSNSPDSDTDPHIQVGIISGGNIVFESKGSENDSTVIVESPLVAQGSIDFGRDRGSDNTYPGEVVKFNPIYVTKLEDAPISLINILWMLEE